MQMRGGGAKSRYRDQKCVEEKRRDEKRAVVNSLSSERKGKEESKEKKMLQICVQGLLKEQPHDLKWSVFRK